MRGWCSWLWYPVYKVSCLMGGNELEITFRLQNVDKTKQSRSTQGELILWNIDAKVKALKLNH